MDMSPPSPPQRGISSGTQKTVMLEPHLKRAEDAVHCDEVHLHHSPLLLAQVALDLVQHAAHTRDTMKTPGCL